MAMEIVNFLDWEFLVDREVTEQTYNKVAIGGADSCGCSDCQNYVAFRENVFPDEIKALFQSLGIDYRKEVEVTSLEVNSEGLHHIAGWFHFKGQILKGQDGRIDLPGGGFSWEYTKVTDNFAFSFLEGNSLTYFKDTTGLVQVEFETYIPWIIDKSLDTSIE